MTDTCYRSCYHSLPDGGIIGGYDDDTLPPARLLLDLDYIVRWVSPAGGEDHFIFWIAPATLVFEQAWNISGQIGPLHEVMEIAGMHRLGAADSSTDPLWHIEGQNFDLRLRASRRVRTLLPYCRAAFGDGAVAT